MQIQNNVPLKEFSTMRLGGNAKHLVIVTSKDELLQSVAWAQARQLPLFVLGYGSNVIIRDEGFNGLIIVNRLAGFDISDETETLMTLRIGAGEDWDSVVERTVSMGLTGIEAMSHIPGTIGATPVQNVGAYGQEIADTLIELEAYDLLTLGFVRITREECGFSYRNSTFKATENRRYVIASVSLQLRRGNPSPPFYDSLQKYFEAHNMDSERITPHDVRQAVIAIRSKKLPDPSQIPNCGSFFKNPIIDKKKYYDLVANHGEMPHFDAPNNRMKLAAGWLIEHAGLKQYSNHGLKTFEGNSLVVVNESSHSYNDLALFKQEIISSVQEKFGITLEQEPELL